MTMLEERLHQAGSDLTMDTGLDQVLARGRVLRWRRLGGAAGAAIGAAAVLAVAVAPLGIGHDASGPADSPWPTSGPPMVALPPSTATAANHTCHSTARGQWSHAALGQLFAAAQTTDTRVLLYRGSGPLTDQVIACEQSVDGDAVGLGGSTFHHVTPGPGHELVSLETAVVEVGTDGQDMLVAAGRVTRAVSRVEGRVDGRTVPAAMADGWFWFWAPVGKPGPTPLPAAYTITAFAADGQVLHTARPALQDWEWTGRGLDRAVSPAPGPG